jgi:dTDP-4-dehydrorhamnose reductase
MRVLVLGAGGMLGNAVYRVISQRSEHEVFGTIRSATAAKRLATSAHGTLLPNVNVLDQDDLVSAMRQSKPDVVVNCVGLVKQLASGSDPLAVLPINSILPHRLARLCALANTRVVHISTDCVFSGRRGKYGESDVSDAEDLYGKSKYIGELREYRNAITLRTSIIGHELTSRHALVEWFLSQEGQVKGYAHAIFSGLPTVELAHVIRDVVLPRSSMNGLYHVAARPISKLELLQLIAEIYGKPITVTPDEHVKVDRSLVATRFENVTGYTAPDWRELIIRMHEFR